MNYRNLLYLILFCNTLFLVSSCSEDEAAKNSGNVYTLTVPEVDESRYEFRAFITDEEGNVLDEGKCSSGKSLQLYAGEYTGIVNFYYVTRLKSTGYCSYSVSTSLNVSSGFEQVVPSATENNWPNLHLLKIYDIPAAYKTLYHVGPTTQKNSLYVLSEPSGGYQLFISPFDTGPITYILTTPNSGSPRYLHFSEPEPDYEVNADFSDFTPAEMVNLNIGEQANEIFIGVSALYPGGVTSSLGSYSTTDADNINFYDYPKDIFPKLLTTVTVDKENMEYGCRKYGDRITEMHWLDADMELSHVENTIAFSASGDYTYARISSYELWSANDTDYSFFWSIGLGDQHTVTVSLPDINKAMGKYWPELIQERVNFNFAYAAKESLVNNEGEILSVGKNF